MVSVGTVLTIGIVAAVGIAGYAVYRNLGKVGKVVTAGVTKSVSDPFGAWLDSVIGGTTNGGGSGAPLPLDPSEPAFGFLPEAEAPLSTDATLAITPTQAEILTKKYLPKAQESAELILKSFAPTSQQQLITTATEIAVKSPTPALTQAFSIVEQARVSVGGVDPLTNRFYQLFSLANKPYGEPGKVLPLSREAVQYYARVGVVAREIYL